MDYKRTYTKDEAEELIHWFETHECEQDIDIGQRVHIKNLSLALKQLFHVARTQYNNPSFSGQINLLGRIKDALIEQGKVKGE